MPQAVAELIYSYCCLKVDKVSFLLLYRVAIFLLKC